MALRLAQLFKVTMLEQGNLSLFSLFYSVDSCRLMQCSMIKHLRLLRNSSSHVASSLTWVMHLNHHCWKPFCCELENGNQFRAGLKLQLVGVRWSLASSSWSLVRVCPAILAGQRWLLAGSSWLLASQNWSSADLSWTLSGTSLSSYPNWSKMVNSRFKLVIRCSELVIR